LEKNQPLPSNPKSTNPELTKRGTIRKRKPKTSNVYFTEETEDAIVEYLKTTDSVKRNLLYNEKINYAFNKLAENIIHTFKFYYTDSDTMPELKHEVVSFLLSKLHLYNKSKGKAYSYFGTITKRYLIIYNEKNYKKLKEKATLEEVDEDKKIQIDINTQTSNTELGNFMNLFIKYMDINMSKYFNKSLDLKIADAILELFKKREELDIFNKKALFIYIREIIDVKTPHITKIIKKIKLIYAKLFNIYYELGDINMSILV
jgi:hypothetical protein